MNWHYIKIGAAVVMVAVLSYIFFSVTAQQGKASVAKSQIKNMAARHTGLLASQRSGVHEKAERHHYRSRRSRPKHEHLAKSKPEPIKPDTTLRKAQTLGHVGPPSKMYGAL